MADRIAFVGAGKMGEALIAGLIRTQQYQAGDIAIVEKSPERAAEMVQTYRVSAQELSVAVSSAQTIVLVVKPADVPAVLRDISDHLMPDALVISVAAGVTISTLEAGLPAQTAVVRVMPNTPALVEQAMSALSAGAHVTPVQLEVACAVFGSVGQSVVVSEVHQDAVTAVSGSGPAYVFLVMEAMTAAGMELGLTRELADQLVRQTVLGAATMAASTGEDPAVLRTNVTSPGGTTAAALAVLEESGLRAIFGQALSAARNRSIELGKTP